MRFVDALRDDAGDQLADRAAHHAGLAEGGEHLVDVVQEVLARAHHKHAGAFESAAVRVQQVGGAVQRHGRLAGAGAALHHEGAGEIGADDPVLLGLDCGHDVGHLAGASRAQRRQQRAFAGQRALLARRVHMRRMHVEHLVFDAGHGAEMQCDVAAHHDVAVV